MLKPGARALLAAFEAELNACPACAHAGWLGLDAAQMGVMVERLGLDRRRIVAGLREHCPPDCLADPQIRPILADIDAWAAGTGAPGPRLLSPAAASSLPMTLRAGGCAAASLRAIIMRPQSWYLALAGDDIANWRSGVGLGPCQPAADVVRREIPFGEAMAAALAAGYR